MRYRQVIVAISLMVTSAATLASSTVLATGDTVPLAGAQKLYEDCSVLAAASADLSDVVKQRRMESVIFCLGYLQATLAALERIHRNYTTQFPNYGHWDDRDFIANWIAAQVLSAPDVCFPEHVNTKILAMIVSKYGKEHPEKLTKNMFDFASWAFESAYPANKGCSH